MIIFVVRQLYREGRLIRERLVDYVAWAGCQKLIPQAMSRLRTRLRALWHAYSPVLKHSLRRFGCSGRLPSWPTCEMPSPAASSTTQVAFGRRTAGQDQIHPWQGHNPAGGRAAYPSLRRRRRVPCRVPAAQLSGPAGLGGNYPAPERVPRADRPARARRLRLRCPWGSATQHSEVDPTWKPPGE